MPLRKVTTIPRLLVASAMGGFLMGMEISSMAIFIGSESFNAYFKYPSPLQQGFVGGSNAVGGLVGSLTSGYVTERRGRVSGLRAAAVVWLMGCLVSTFVVTIEMVMAGRFIKGVAGGIISATLPVYNGEIIPSFRRGLASSVMQWCLTWAILIMFYVSFIANSLASNDWSFRFAWALEAIPGIVLFAYSFVLPESPKWLIMCGKTNEAQYIVNAINQNINRQAPNTKLEINISEKVNPHDRLTYSGLFSKTHYKHTLAGVFVQCLVQLSGIGVLMYYVIYICEMIGLDGNVKIFAASIQYIINVFFTIFPILCLDRLRRKDVLVFGSAVLGVIMLMISTTMGYFGHQVPPIGGNPSVVWEVKDTPGSFVLALCFIFVAIFAATLSCVAWVYTNEILPNHLKSKGTSISTSASWILNFALTFIAPVLLATIKWATFLIFGTLCLVGAFIIAFWFPETYGLNNSELERVFNSGSPREIREKPSITSSTPTPEPIGDTNPVLSPFFKTKGAPFVSEQTTPSPNDLHTTHSNYSQNGFLQGYLGASSIRD